MQALEYAMYTEKKAKYMLIKEKKSDQKYIDRARMLIEFYSLPVELQVVECF